MKGRAGYLPITFESLKRALQILISNLNALIIRCKGNKIIDCAQKVLYLGSAIVLPMISGRLKFDFL